MKTAIRASMILGLFGAMLTLSSPPYAAAFVSSPAFGIRPETISGLQEKWDSRLPFFFKKKKADASADPYVHALKVARLLATSA